MRDLNSRSTKSISSESRLTISVTKPISLPEKTTHCSLTLSSPTLPLLPFPLSHPHVLPFGSELRLWFQAEESERAERFPHTLCMYIVYSLSLTFFRILTIRYWILSLFFSVLVLRRRFFSFSFLFGYL